jgi:hypothetical protein
VTRQGRAVLSVFLALSSTSGTNSEYQLKAAFLLNFASFVEWPAASFSSPTDPLVFSVFRKDPFDGALQSAAKEKWINGRPVLIHVTSDPAVLRSSHVVFFPASEARDYSRAARAMSGLNILTVGEDSDFIDRGGIINFVIRNTRVSFEINSFAAERSHLKISSKLLQLARVVER